ncbi:MAG: LPS export ABC transporter periplasmic protein LptC [Tepidimonas ignava]|uniref:Lipopolysaccharide export system protein LptC n=1 Tax=Tepidimonas ignava TaxID=114249 RepID=A0A4V2UW13_9BURK|nr:LPS export ABC transporter periplasmic protein LptC [Tepidimonas ignava]MCX7814751.1 LPS export ABC transporter periplasmic protein LptC [Tepidimonas ignava]TCS97857.1 lipopolysaccharide export system protein LptC [Tepidimonas ignava]TSE23719.1 Lipopolysaccharide export system protein LptC [Tepidimonas ignava]
MTPRAAPPPPRPTRPAQPWWVRAWDVASLYLPVALMGTLALLTWAVVQRVPTDHPSPSRALGQGEPDYTLHHFTLQRWSAPGQPELLLRGDRLVHYPADARTDIEQAHLQRVVPADATRSTLRAHLLQTDDRRVHYTLRGQVRYERTPLRPGGAPRLTLDAEELTWDSERQVLQSTQPVRMTRDADVITANQMRYDERHGLAEWQGQVRATLVARAGQRAPR